MSLPVMEGATKALGALFKHSLVTVQVGGWVVEHLFCPPPPSPPPPTHPPTHP